MARDEVADIVSYDQYLFVKKQAKSAEDKNVRSLDSRGMPHRAKRDERGRVVEPGGGKADSPMSPEQAKAMLIKLKKKGIDPRKLPKKSDSRNAARKDLEHAKMRHDRVVRPAIRPPGTATYMKQLQRQRQILDQNSKEYLSKSINEKFITDLDEALGLNG